MVRTYKRKGGHGGSRLGSGLPTAYWEKQGGRKEAAIDKGVKEAMRPIHARLREVEKRTIRKRPAAILRRPAACVMKRPAGYAVAYRGPAAAMP